MWVIVIDNVRVNIRMLLQAKRITVFIGLHYVSCKFATKGGSQKSRWRICQDSVKQDCVRVWDLALTLWDIINHGYKVRSCNISLFLAQLFLICCGSIWQAWSHWSQSLRMVNGINDEFPKYMRCPVKRLYSLE